MSRGYVHETAVGATVDWLTPSGVFERLGLRFDLDPCGNPSSIVPADWTVMPPADGLSMTWAGSVWLNPPYGPSMPPFIDRFIEHGNGIALVFARTDTRVMQRLIRAADAVCFTADRLHFIRASDGYQSRAGMGSMFAAFGVTHVEALQRADFGVVVYP